MILKIIFISMFVFNSFFINNIENITYKEKIIEKKLVINKSLNKQNYFIWNKIVSNKQNFKKKDIIENKKNNILNLKDEIKITIGWDVMLSRTVWYYNQKDFWRITKKFNPITQTWWIVFLNLESPFSKIDKDWFHASYLFWANIWSIQTLNDLKKDNEMVLSLANNHIRNSWKSWVETTIALLSKNNINYSGIWLNKNDSEKILQIKKWNNLICFQSFSYDWWEYNRISVNYLSENNIKLSLDKMKLLKCNLNLLSFHWGREYKFKPTDKQIELGHYSIDNWADMIIGHHSHIFWKTEIYKEKPIYYSLWNYIFDQDAIIWSCWYWKDCIYDEKSKKTILPVQIWVSYELIFKNKKLIKSTQKKHRMVNYWELIEY